MNITAKILAKAQTLAGDGKAITAQHLREAAKMLGVELDAVTRKQLGIPAEASASAASASASKAGTAFTFSE